MKEVMNHRIERNRKERVREMEDREEGRKEGRRRKKE